MHDGYVEATLKESSRVEQQASISIKDNVIHCRGAWTLSNLSHLERGGQALRWPDAPTVFYDAGEVTAMDTGGALMLQRCYRRPAAQGATDVSPGVET